MASCFIQRNHSTGYVNPMANRQITAELSCVVRAERKSSCKTRDTRDVGPNREQVESDDSNRCTAMSTPPGTLLEVTRNALDNRVSDTLVLVSDGLSNYFLSKLSSSLQGRCIKLIKASHRSSLPTTGVFNWPLNPKLRTEDENQGGFKCEFRTVSPTGAIRLPVPVASLALEENIKTSMICKLASSGLLRD